MATNVPVPVFGPTGYAVPTDAAILAGVQQDINAAFGGNLSFSTTTGSQTNPTPQGQLAASWAAIISQCYQQFLTLTQMQDPANAVGRYQDSVGRIYFLQRLGAQPTTVQVLCTGLSGVVIPVGAQARAADGNVYSCTQAGTIPVGGSITLAFACNVPGPIACPATTLNQIYQAITGWDTVNNPADGVIGQNTETRYQFEARRQATIAANSVNSNQAVLGALLQVPGVLGAYVVDNPANSPATIGGVTIPANTQYVAVVGGAAAAVGAAIWSKKPPGPPLFAGGTSVVVQDLSPAYVAPFPSYTISWQTPINLAVVFAVNIVAGAQVPGNAATLIQNAIIAAFAGADGGTRATIGSLVLAMRYAAPIQALGSWAQIRTLQVGSLNTPSATFVGHIIGTALTVISVTSGAIATLQTVKDAAGLTLPGTTIVSGASLAWVVSTTQNVGATFTGTGSGTNLTASAVTGSILPGQLVNGTGVPANTTIVSQTSGPAGGAGVYVTNNATTSAGNALSSNPTLFGVLAGSPSTQANINQQPTVNALDIAVTVS